MSTPSTVLALMGIKSFLVDPHGVWDNATADPCSWNMVTCPIDGLVISLTRIRYILVSDVCVRYILPTFVFEQCDPKIVHRDVKAANILLDDYYEAIIGDFGLAKSMDHRDSHVTTAVRGTVGHIAPEYPSTRRSSKKTDI
ncbi:hypothetical protein V6N13_035750 [Hibiscus sabdariffa]